MGQTSDAGPPARVCVYHTAQRSAADVALQLLDGFLLLLDHRLHQIANRQHADQLALGIQDRQVTDVLVGHQRQAMRNVQVGSAMVRVLFMVGVAVMLLAVTVYAFVALVGFLG